MSTNESSGVTNVAIIGFGLLGASFGLALDGVPGIRRLCCTRNAAARDWALSAHAADFASECDISRTKFFYKVKGLTGMTPTEFFRVYRLNRSVELIKADKYKISSIAEMCGFSSPSHFAVSFKKQFGMLPSEYLNQ